MTRAFGNYIKELNTPVPQSKPENELQVPNNAGGFTFQVTPQERLERFLILGTDGGTYYVSEKDLTKQNVDWLIKHVSTLENALTTLQTVVEISQSGRAFRNSASIFTMALLFKYAPQEVKSSLVTALPKVARTSTHLFEFAQYTKQMGGWNRTKRSAVALWYTNKSDKDLAYQTVKYRQRNGWTHRDLFRLSHPRGVNAELGNFILGKELGSTLREPIITGFKTIQSQTDLKYVLNNLALWPELPWEAIPTQFLKEPEVWKKLFYNGQLNGQALVRNVTRLSRIGAFNDMVFTADYAAKLVNEEMIARTRIHPINYLNAVVVHQEGQVQRRSDDRLTWFIGSRNKDWNTVPKIVDALNVGFHLAFKYMEPANKRTLIGLDVSGSMSSLASGIDLSCAQVGAAVAMTVAKTEPYFQVMGFATQFRDLGITPAMNLRDILARTQNVNFGGTDCSLPMTWALTNKIEVDTFLVITDHETWAGRVHPHVALKDYRQKMGIDAKLIVAGVAATDFTIADPNDRGMLDVVGFDSNGPKVIADFSAGRI